MDFSRRLVSLILVLAIAGCNTAQATQSVPAQASQTATAAPTLLPVIATETEQPEPSPGPILTPIPTPAGSSSSYHLAAQTADQADENITRMEQTILGLENVPPPENMPGYRGPYYVPFYRAAWYIAWDALAHFPDDPRAEKWRSKMAYYMTLAGEGDEAAQIYMDQITTALNSGKVNTSNLGNWFQSGQLEKTLYTPLFTLEKQPVKVPNTQDGTLIAIGKPNSMNSPGRICLLVVKKAGKYTAYDVYNGFSSGGYYDVLIRHPTSCSLEDVTDDGVDEIIVSQYDGMHYGSTTIRVNSLASLPPRVLPFTEKKDAELHLWNGGVQGYPKAAGQTQILIEASIGDTSCDNYYIWPYRWNGRWFDLQNEDIHFGEPSAWCADTAIRGSPDLGTQYAANFTENAVQAYRPHASELGDMFNELVVREAGYEAVSGEKDKAIATLNGFLQAPSPADSVWLDPARKFLATYQQLADLYQACVALTACAPYRGKGGSIGASEQTCEQTTVCDAKAALQRVIQSAYASLPLAELPTKLEQLGVDIKANGWFDFDQDKQDELWFTLFDPVIQEYDLWIIAKSSTGNSAFNFGWITLKTARPKFQIEHSQAYPTYVTAGEDLDFELLRDPGSGQARLNILDLPDPADSEAKTNATTFEQLRQTLLAGGNPVSGFEQLVVLERKYATCPLEIEQADGSLHSYYDCGAFYYTLAFAAEVAGNKEEAVKRYYAEWSAYPDSPFALLAREKLKR